MAEERVRAGGRYCGAPSEKNSILQKYRSGNEK